MFNLILISHRASGQSVRRSLHAPSHFVALGTVFVSLLAGVAAAGYYVGSGGRSDEGGMSWQMRLAQQQEELADVRREASAEVDAMTGRLARLQSHVTRLEALGRKLIDAANIDADEFDFDSKPGMGGPVAALDGDGIDAGELDRAIESMSLRLTDRERQLSVLDDVLAERRLDAASTPAGEPITEGWMSSSYGYRKDPFSGKRAWHDGVDFAGREGSPIHAVGAGVVTFAGERWGYGNLVEITHGDGYVTRYGHNARIVVEEGQVVRRGDKVAEMGSTGRSTGPHVHLEVLKNGESLNPWKYVQATR